MAAGTWKIYAKAKKYIGAGTITLGTGVFKMMLHRPSASAAIAVLSTRSVSTSIPGEVSAVGGYVAGGRNLLPATGYWSVGASAKQYKFYYSTVGLIFTASGVQIQNIKYATIKFSTGNRLLCYCSLSTAAFTLGQDNTLTIAPAATGVFTMT